MLIARLIADPDGLETRIDAAIAALKGQGMPVSAARMLEHSGNVLQLSLAEGDRATLRTIIEDFFAPDAALITDHEPTLPRIFVSDMDSTMIGQECIDELADFAGIKDRVAQITERAMRGELDFSAALRERVGLLAGLDEEAIERCLKDRIRPENGARILVQTLKSLGCKPVLVTGGFYHFADIVAGQLGFDRVVANQLRVTNGQLTGALEGPISDGATKLAVLQEERSAAGSGTVLAAGDGANDVPMLSGAEYGFAYKARPAPRAAAAGWIDRGDLTQILQLLDIPQSDWAR